LEHATKMAESTEFGSRLR